VCVLLVIAGGLSNLPARWPGEPVLAATVPGPFPQDRFPGPFRNRSDCCLAPLGYHEVLALLVREPEPLCGGGPGCLVI